MFTYKIDDSLQIEEVNHVITDVNAVNNSGTRSVYLREAGLMSKYEAFCQTRDEEACIHTRKIMKSQSYQT